VHTGTLQDSFLRLLWTQHLIKALKRIDSKKSNWHFFGQTCADKSYRANGYSQFGEQWQCWWQCFVRRPTTLEWQKPSLHCRLIQQRFTLEGMINWRNGNDWRSRLRSSHIYPFRGGTPKNRSCNRTTKLMRNHNVEKTLACPKPLFRGFEQNEFVVQSVDNWNSPCQMRYYRESEFGHWSSYACVRHCHDRSFARHRGTLRTVIVCFAFLTVQWRDLPTAYRLHTAHSLLRRESSTAQHLSLMHSAYNMFRWLLFSGDVVLSKPQNIEIEWHLFLRGLFQSKHSPTCFWMCLKCTFHKYC